jgi:hypothetical protein
VVTRLEQERTPAALVQLHQTALRLLMTHLACPSGGSACAICGTHWPCEQTLLAAWTLEVTS